MLRDKYCIKRSWPEYVLGIFAYRVMLRYDIFHNIFLQSLNLQVFYDSDMVQLLIPLNFLLYTV